MSRLNLVDPSEMPDSYDAEEDLPGDMEFTFNEYRKHAPTHRSWRNNPEVHEFYVNAFLTLWREDITGLSMRETELIIIGTSRLLDFPLEWNLHVHKAIDEGFSEAEIVAIYDWAFDELDPKDAALARYIKAFAEMNVTNEIHDELAEHYDDREIVGIMEVIGFYVHCCLKIHALGIRTAEARGRYDHLSLEALEEDV